MTKTSDETREIANRLGSAFAVVVSGFLPAATEALGRTDKEISFGATVHLKKEAGVISGKITCHEPKIPTPPIQPIHFLLQRDDNGQLSFLFSGSLKEQRAVAIAGTDMEKPKDGDYEPGDSVTGS